jgi:hypothetical protein
MNYEEYVKKQKRQIQNNSNASLFARDSYTSSLISNEELLKPTQYEAYKSKYAFNPNTDTTEGLYNIATQVGLKQDAKRVLEKVGGENGKFFSGGFVGDIFDILNIGSYGVVGLVKGKGFIEGVKNRESLSDDDALGKYGFAGQVAGFVGDIVLDPLTYVAPLKLVTKIPGATRLAEKGMTKAFGKIERESIAGGKTVFNREGGWTPLTFMADKLVYGFAVDKKTLEGVQKIKDSASVALSEAEQLLSVFSKIDPKISDKVLTWKPDGFGGDKLGRADIDDLRRVLDDDQYQATKSVYNAIEKAADKLEELGVLSKETRQQHIDDYVVQMYDEFLEKQATKPSLTKGGSRLDYKARKSLTEAQKKERKIVENSSVVLGTTLLKQVELIKRAELQNYLSKNLALSVDEASEFGIDLSKYHHVSDVQEYKVRRNVDEKKSLLKLNKELKTVIKERRKTVGEHKGLLKELDDIEKRIVTLDKLSKTNISEALSGYRKLLDEGGISKGARKKVPTSEGQKELAKAVKSWLNKGKKSERVAMDGVDSKKLLDEFLSTRAGLALERAFDDPQMMYQWNSIEEFFDAVRYPGKKVIAKNAKDGLEEITDAQALAKIKRAEKQQREIGKLKQTYTVLKDTNLELVEKAMMRLEEDYADMLFKKKNLLDTININEMGNLAGKYVPKEVWDMVKGTFEPKKQFGEALTLKFKHAKVIWNPAAFPRNALSAMIANWWELGLGPWNVNVYRDAYTELKNGSKIIDRMKKQGFSETTGVLNELRGNYLASKQFKSTLINASSHPAKKTLQQLRNLDKWMTNSYGHIDNVAKVAAFKHAVKKGMSDEDAMKAAYNATFNYSHVTPFVHAMRRNMFGVPFITFNLKAVPLVARTLVNSPGKISVFGKARNDLFKAAGVEAEQEAEAMPEWMRDSSFMLRLPWKDGDGRAMYFDLTYIMPFGAIMSGEYARSPFSQNPVLQTIRELSSNKTFSGQRIFNESDDMDTVIRDVFIHTSKLLLPPAVADQLPQGYDNKGNVNWKPHSPLAKFQGVEQDRGANERTMTQEIFKLMGASVTPFDLDSRVRQFDYRRKKALQQLLVQKGVLNEYTRPYVPEESQLNEPSAIYDRQMDSLGR